MTTLNQEEATPIIFNYLVDNLPNEVDISNVRFPNAKGITGGNRNWIDTFIDWAPSSRIGAGKNSLYRTNGIFIIDVYVPKGSGDEAVRSIMNHFRSLFINNQEFLDLGFVVQSTQQDNFNDDSNEQFYIERFNCFFYIEGF